MSLQNLLDELDGNTEAAAASDSALEPDDDDHDDEGGDDDGENSAADIDELIHPTPRSWTDKEWADMMDPRSPAAPHLGAGARSTSESPSLDVKTANATTGNGVSGASTSSPNGKARAGNAGSSSATRAKGNTGAAPRAGGNTVYVDHREALVAADVIQVLGRTGAIYQRDGALVRVLPDDGNRPRIRGMTVANVREAAARFCVFKTNSKKPKIIHPPQWMAPMVYASGVYSDMPVLRGVVSAPTLRPDGSVITAPGYDRTTGLYYVPMSEYPAVPKQAPTRDDARASAKTLLDVFADFPFKDSTDGAATLALIEALVMRDQVDGPVPAALVNGNVPGIGKGKLVMTAGAIALGVKVAIMPKTDDDESTRKRLTAFAEHGERILLLDNVTSFGGPIWDAALTSERITDRPVGAREMIDLPWRAVVAVTGNGVRLLGDMGRRVLPIRLHTSIVEPEGRTGFKHPLPRWALANHPTLYMHALTIARYALIDQTTDVGGTPWGSYESWFDLVRRAVVLATDVDPMATRELVKRADENVIALRQLLLAIHNLGRLTASNLIAKAEDLQQPNRELREALSVLAPGPGGRLHPRGVGSHLQRHVDRVVRYDDGAEYALRRDDKSSLGTLWFAERVRDPDPITPKGNPLDEVGGVRRLTPPANGR